MNLFTNMMRKSLHNFDHLAQKAEPTLRSKKKWTLGPISCCTAVPALRAIYQRDVQRIARGLAIASSELALLFCVHRKDFLGQLIRFFTQPYSKVSGDQTWLLWFIGHSHFICEKISGKINIDYPTYSKTCMIFSFNGKNQSSFDTYFCSKNNVWCRLTSVVVAENLSLHRMNKND